MQEWVKVMLILCAFGTLREIRPSEPFVSEFLLGEWRDITEEQLNRDVYPLGTYFYLGLIEWNSSVCNPAVDNQLRMAPGIAVLLRTYPIVSSYTRIAALTGRFLSGVSAQLLTHYGLMNYRQLNYITFTDLGDNLRVHAATDAQSFRSNVTEAATLISRHACAAYSRPRVVAWSALYAAAMALFVQAQVYVQLLWKQIQEESAAPTLLGAGGAYLASTWTRSALPAPTAALQGVALFLGSFVPNIFVSYAGYIKCLAQGYQFANADKNCVCMCRRNKNYKEHKKVPPKFYTAPTTRLPPWATKHKTKSTTFPPLFDIEVYQDMQYAGDYTDEAFTVTKQWKTDTTAQQEPTEQELTTSEYPYMTSAPYPYMTSAPYPYMTSASYPYMTSAPYPYMTSAPYPYMTSAPDSYMTTQHPTDPQSTSYVPDANEALKLTSAPDPNMTEEAPGSNATTVSDGIVTLNTNSTPQPDLAE
ncbi:Uncharacterized protein OBRU01_04567 [Operophtera brumata]|uniref:Uncharacterized protein n=1 Tax=Operophtera brumata TaxID=104452 RepID=A0A0L7LMV8_OPEBR|nr:Uncharacterized protein OBRU01_04567 [Operophtera brumata]